jgi:hypothetical protein
MTNRHENSRDRYQASLAAAHAAALDAERAGIAERAELCADCRFPVEYAYCPTCGEPQAVREMGLLTHPEVTMAAVLGESARLLDERDEDQRSGDPVCCAECESGLRDLYPHTFREGCGQRVRNLYRLAADEAGKIERALYALLGLHQDLIDAMAVETLSAVGSDPYVTVYPFDLSVDDQWAEVGRWAEMLEGRA